MTSILGSVGGNLLGTAKQLGEQIKEHPVETAGVLGVGATGVGAGVGYAVNRRRKSSKKKSSSSKRQASRRHRSATRRKSTGTRRRVSSAKARKPAKKHKPRARGGVHNGRRVLIAKNGTRYVKLKNGQVRFIK